MGPLREGVLESIVQSGATCCVPPPPVTVVCGWPSWWHLLNRMALPLPSPRNAARTITPRYGFSSATHRFHTVRCAYGTRYALAAVKIGVSSPPPEKAWRCVCCWSFTCRLGAPPPLRVTPVSCSSPMAYSLDVSYCGVLSRPVPLPWCS